MLCRSGWLAPVLESYPLSGTVHSNNCCQCFCKIILRLQWQAAYERYMQSDNGTQFIGQQFALFPNQVSQNVTAVRLNVMPFPLHLSGIAPSICLSNEVTSPCWLGPRHKNTIVSMTMRNYQVPFPWELCVLVHLHLSPPHRSPFYHPSATQLITHCHTICLHGTWARMKRVMHTLSDEPLWSPLGGAQ